MPNFIFVCIQSIRLIPMWASTWSRDAKKETLFAHPDKSLCPDVSSATYHPCFIDYFLQPVALVSVLVLSPTMNIAPLWPDPMKPLQKKPMYVVGVMLIDCWCWCLPSLFLRCIKCLNSSYLAKATCVKASKIARLFAIQLLANL